MYRSMRAPSNTPPQPAPPETIRVLNLLFASAVVWLISTLPYFTPLNVFKQTGSRLKITTPVLFNRFSALTPQLEALRDVFAAGGQDARLQYLRFGPDVLCNCPLVSDPKAHDAPNNYMICALPSLLKPHLLQLFLLGLATSVYFGGQYAARWRKAAVVSAVVVMVADVLSVATYDHSRNATAATAADLDNFFWFRLTMSRVALLATDAVVAYLIWASSTNRAFVVPPSPAVQLEAQTRMFETAIARFRALGAVRNVVMRDAGFREKLSTYWKKEGEVTQEIFEDRDVLEALNGVLGRMDVSAVDREAQMHVENFLGPAVVPSAEGPS